MKTYEDKCRRLHQIMRGLTEQDTAVAFSGGADSSLLLKLAAHCSKENKTKVYAITASTELHPVSDIQAAAQTAEEIGVKHLVLHLNELEHADICQNPVDRCYRCKKYLFREMQRAAEELQIDTLLEGTNADDLKVYRPGLKALSELGVISPLKEAGMTKEEVRRLAREYGITAADRPAAPCLATRFPYGAELTQEKLKRVEQGEVFLKGFGFYNVRLRDHGGLARIEVDEREFPLVCGKREEIAGYLRKLGFDYVTLDLEGFRSGSMDLHVKEKP
ncbi:MAG: ATP-dependent sacrificial sulfur transferase LarE [Eubacteriales bacterium]|nr:ATP-dependent sacrificial sulfur transferase LarE [Eubacteriales bacterium]